MRKKGGVEFSNGYRALLYRGKWPLGRDGILCVFQTGWDRLVIIQKRRVCQLASGRIL